MMAQLQKMQQQLAEAQAKLAEETVTSTAGGGAIKVTMTGDQKCRSVEINPEFIKDMDAEMLAGPGSVRGKHGARSIACLGGTKIGSTGRRIAVLAMIDLLSKDDPGLKDLQVFHRELDKEKQFDQDIFRNIAYLSGEIGELVSAIRTLRKANDADVLEAQNHVGEELADCLAYVVKLANYTEIDLNDAYISKMKRNLNREWHPEIK